jgi:hypothetical protein
LKRSRYSANSLSGKTTNNTSLICLQTPKF